MRRIAFMAALLLCGGALAFGQAGQGPTPPGPDSVGADHGTRRPGSVSRSDAQQNQRSTNTTGTSWGDERQTSNAGTSVYSTSTAREGVKGQQGEESAISGRQRAHNRRYSSKDTNLQPMNNGEQHAIGSRANQGTERSQASHTSRRNARRHHRRKRQDQQQQNEPK